MAKDPKGLFFPPLRGGGAGKQTNKLKTIHLLNKLFNLFKILAKNKAV